MKIPFNNIYKDKKVLITGHTGFKGSWLSIWLKKLNANVYGISKDIPTNPNLFVLANLKDEIIHNKLDIRNFTLLLDCINKIKPDFIFHMAAQSLVSKSFIDPIDTFSTNIIGTGNILECIKKINHPCVGIIITSDKCYDNLELDRGYHEEDILGGKDPYSASKGSAELVFKSYYNSFFIQQDKIRISTVRAGNVIGGGDWAKNRIIPDCIRAWENNKSVVIRNPNSTRPWQHVLEPLSGYLHLGHELFKKNKLNGQSFNFGPLPDNNHTVIELIKEMINNYKKISIKGYEVLNNNDFEEAKLLKLNCNKVFKKINWVANLNFQETIFFTADWYNNYNNSDNPLVFTIKQIDKYCKKAFDNDMIWMK